MNMEMIISTYPTRILTYIELKIASLVMQFKELNNFLL